MYYLSLLETKDLKLIFYLCVGPAMFILSLVSVQKEVVNPCTLFSNMRNL